MQEFEIEKKNFAKNAIGLLHFLTHIVNLQKSTNLYKRIESN